MQFQSCTNLGQTTMPAATTGVATVPGTAATMEATTAPPGMHSFTLD